VLPGHVRIVEDAACAAGAVYRGRPAGGLGDAGCFSFHPRKSITTGEGGMLTTADAAVAERASCLRNHGASVPEETRHRGAKPYQLPDFEVLGFNYRMSDIQGAIGLVQLRKLDAFIAEREAWARWYEAELGGLRWLATPKAPQDCRHAWQAYVCLVDDDARLSRDGLMERLMGRGIATRPGTHAITTLGLYRTRFNIGPNDFPVAAMLERQTIALPLHNRMSATDFRRVVEALSAI
jgi:perosamine synthetase